MGMILVLAGTREEFSNMIVIKISPGTYGWPLDAVFYDLREISRQNIQLI